MAHQTPDFETKDVLGTTRHFNGNVGAGELLIPNTPEKKISDVFIRNPASNLNTDRLSVSIDGGSSFIVLARGEFIQWSPKNTASGDPIKQIRLKGNREVINYETLFNFEP